jgi:hypothetical protein
MAQDLDLVLVMELLALVVLVLPELNSVVLVHMNHHSTHQQEQHLVVLVLPELNSVVLVHMNHHTTHQQEQHLVVHYLKVNSKLLHTKVK